MANSFIGKDVPAPVQKAGEAGKPAERKIVLEPTKSEVVPIRVRSPENVSQKVKITEETHGVLVDSIAFNIDIATQMGPAVNPASFLGKFVEAFKAQYPGIDLKNKEQVRQSAEDFLRNGGGRAVLTSLKLLEWEGSLIHGATNARFKEKQKATDATSTKKKEELLHFDSHGAEVTTKEKTSWFMRGQKEREGIFTLEIGNATVTHGTMITDPTEVAYLNQIGLANGVNLQDQEVASYVRQRLLNIAGARSELFIGTGLSPSKVDLNFLDGAGNYRAGRGAYFLGETGTGDFSPGSFSTEGITIVDEIKTKAQEKLKKKIESGRSEERAGTAIRKRIEELQKKKNGLTPEERTKRETALQKEIDDLNEKLQLFERKKALDGATGEITAAEKQRDKARDNVTTRQGELTPPPGETAIDLLKWSDPADPESWVRIQSECDTLKRQRTSKENRMARLRSQMEAWKQSEPELDFEETVSAKGVTTRKPTADSLKARTDWRTELTRLNTEITTLTDEIYKAPSGGGQSLEEKIMDLEDKYTRRKEVVEEQETQAVLRAYHDSERTLTQKRDEKKDVDKKIKKLPTALNSEKAIRDKIEANQVEKTNLDGLSPDDKREIDALTLVASLYDNPAARDAMNERLLPQAIGVTSDLEATPDYKDYPPVVLQTVRLMFGDEALSTLTNPELAKQVHSLLESKWYLQIMVDEIENQNSIGGAAKVDFGAAVRAPGGKNEQISMKTIKSRVAAGGGKPIGALNISDVSPETVRKIVDRVRRSALGFK